MLPAAREPCCQLPDLSLSAPLLQAFEASAEAVKTAQQVKGTVMPLTAAKSAVEMVKITAEMKVGTSACCCVAAAVAVPAAGAVTAVLQGRSRSLCCQSRPVCSMGRQSSGRCGREAE